MDFLCLLAAVWDVGVGYRAVWSCVHGSGLTWPQVCGNGLHHHHRFVRSNGGTRQRYLHCVLRRVCRCSAGKPLSAEAGKRFYFHSFVFLLFYLLYFLCWGKLKLRYILNKYVGDNTLINQGVIVPFLNSTSGA